MSNEAPIADWVTIPDLYRDPYPIYQRLRAEGGVHWVPAVNRYLITSYEAVHGTELDQETFSADEEGSLMIRAMGHSMLRRDDPEHYIERRAWQPALRPGVVKRTWAGIFQQNAERYLDEFIEKGSGADLVWDFAAPYASENLRQVIGLYNATQEDLQRWSQTMIDATGNYADDPEVWALGERSFDEVDIALDEMLQWHADHPDHSLISQLLQIPDYDMPLDRIRANLKMSIGGGLNEPRDAIGVTAWALMSNPDQLAAVQSDPSLWQAAFDESIRWVSPIGMYGRQTTREVELCGVRLPARARLGICILSANRDASVWDDAERFDLHREQQPHLAFGKGVHVCLGAWVARSEVADVALPMLFSRLADLRLSATDPAEDRGWVFRGMTKLPVEWSGVVSTGTGGAPDETARFAPRVAIVGSGPSGCFAAQALRRSFPNAPIEVFEELPTPYGLVRYGVAGDHQGTKAVARQFDRLFLEDGVVFRGNVGLGDDVSLADLREAYDAVVLATGMHGDAGLPVPGAHLARGAGAITRFLNGHPDESRPRPLGERVVVVGHGNVAMDIARLLARDSAGLAGSDIDDAVHRHLAGAVRSIHLVGRSTPDAAKFDPVMVRELAGLPGVRHVVHGAGDLSGDGRDARVDAVRSLVEQTATDRHRADAGETRIVMEWWFGLSPARIEGGDGVSEVVFDSADGEIGIPADDVITAVGFREDPRSPISAGAFPDGRVEPGLYAAGWLRRGPRGTIPDQRSDARGLAQSIADDLREGRVAASRPGLAALPHEVDFDGWRRIDLRERLDAAPGRERVKMTTREAMLEAAADLSLPLPEPERSGSLAAGVPVTILFGTESGGAELVADELRRLFGEDADVRVRDLANTAPGDLHRERLHLLVCSTYGDGEVPTLARPFHEALLAGADLAGLRYAVFGMGDRSYEKTYSRGSELIDEALAESGATRLGEYGRHDASGPIPAAEAARDWAEGVLAEATAAVAPVRAG